MSKTGGIEIDHGHVDLSTGIIEGNIELMLGQGWAGRHHSSERPQGYLNSIVFLMNHEEASKLRDWLSVAIDELK